LHHEIGEEIKMAKPYSITDFIFNRPKAKPEFSEGMFRTVPGRFMPIEDDATPVKVVNTEEYGMSQSTFVLVNANQEYIIQGIATMTTLVIKARGGIVQFSIYEGQSNLVYTLLADGQAFEISGVPFGQITKPMNLYVQSPAGGTVVEIMGMRLI
jgi:hypothetical protein